MALEPRLFPASGGGICADNFSVVPISAYGPDFVARDVDPSIAAWRIRFDAEADVVVVAYDGMSNSEAQDAYEADVAERNAAAQASLNANANG